MNNASLIQSIVERASPPPVVSRRQCSPESSDPVLVAPLPSGALLLKESTQLAAWEYETQLEESKRLHRLKEAAIDTAPPKPSGSTPATAPAPTRSALAGSSKAVKKTYALHDVFKAIDDRDIMTLSVIRDQQFRLLLQKPPSSASVFPIVYAARCGPKYESVLIILVGALSRYVNHLEDEELSKEDRDTLKILRINLKAAIDQGVASQQTNLISSYLQVLVMSEGERFIEKCQGDLKLALAQGPPAKPVAIATRMVRQFLTRDLRQGATLAAVEDYVANAASDLLLFALFSLLAPATRSLPFYTFGRDTRTIQSFQSELEDLGPSQKKSPRLRRLASAFAVIGDTKLSFPARLAQLEKVVDGAGGLK